jgi:hypothetical protein
MDTALHEGNLQQSDIELDFSCTGMYSEDDHILPIFHGSKLDTKMIERPIQTEAYKLD